MIDQATELRKLVLQSARQNRAPSGPPSRLCLMLSGKHGVGVTTLAVNLSVALSEQGARVVLVDADLQRQDVMLFCGLTNSDRDRGWNGVRTDVHEVLQRGPAGIQIVPAIWSPRQEAEWTEGAQERLVRQLKTLGRHADLVIVDVGQGASEFLRHCGRAADDMVVVTTSDAASIMESYARLKGMLDDASEPALQLILNHGKDPEEADDVYLRMRDSCRRFLGRDLALLGAIPQDPHAERAGERGAPFILQTPECLASQAVQRSAATLWADCKQINQSLRRSA